MSTLSIRRRLFGVILSIGALALAMSIGYLYRDRSADLAIYDRHLFGLSMMVLMSDALEHENYDTLRKLLTAEIERGISGMVHLYDKHEFSDGKRVRCAVTRKVRVLHKKHKILLSREELEELEYPYDQVIEYLDSNCKGSPSHEDWTAGGDSKNNRK